MTEPVAPGPRERLLEAAEQLIYAGGIHATGVEAIMRRSGTARKSFYTYFSSKEDLIAAALRGRDERWMTWFEAATLASAATPGERLLGMFDALHAWFASGAFHGCAFLNAAGEIKHRDDAIFKISHEHKQRLLRFVETLCDAFCDAAHAPALARQMLILIDGAIAVALVSGTPDAARDAREAAAVLLAQHALPLGKTARTPGSRKRSR